MLVSVQAAAEAGTAAPRARKELQQHLLAVFSLVSHASGPLQDAWLLS